MRHSTGAMLLIDVPVFRLSRADWAVQQRRTMEAHLHRIEEEMEGAAEFNRKFHEDLWRDENPYCWFPNEIVGWISLYSYMGTQIRGDLFFVNRRVVRRSDRKRFVWKCELFQMEAWRSESSSTVFERIIKEIDEARKSKRLKRRHVDTSQLESIGPHLNWLGLLKEERIRLGSMATEEY